MKIKSMNLPSKMQGLSLIGWAALIFLIAFVAGTALKVVPVYFDNFNMKKIINKAVTSGELAGKSKSQVKSFLNSRYQMNSLYDMKADNYIIDRASNGALNINANYEKRVPYFYNIDLVFTFDDMVFEVNAPE